MQEEYINRFIGFPGYKLRRVYFLDKDGHETMIDADVEEVIVELNKTVKGFRCQCGRYFETYYDRRDQFVRDLPWGPWRNVFLMVPRFRVDCPECGVKTEDLEALVPHCTYTRRLAEVIEFACNEVRSIAAIAESFNLSWDTVKNIDRKRLEKTLNPPDLSDLRLLAIDEFAIHKNHEYATVFLDLDRNKILWICRGRRREDIEKVFREIFGQTVCDGIEAVAMDCWAPYENAVNSFLPNAKIVWDMFHIIRNYNKDVIDRVRKQEAYGKLGNAGEMYKKSRFIVLKNPCNLTGDEPDRLKNLLKANKNIFKVYLLGDVLKKLWDYRYSQCAEKWFMGWYNQCIHSRIGPLKSFAEKLFKRIDGIIAHCKFPIHTSILEGVNNKIKVIKRVAYGYRDEEYFFLKIRKHFDGLQTIPQ